MSEQRAVNLMQVPWVNLCHLPTMEAGLRLAAEQHMTFAGFEAAAVQVHAGGTCVLLPHGDGGHAHGEDVDAAA